MKPRKGPVIQKSVRFDPDFIERVEERAMAESLALGVSVDFSVLARRGLEMVLASPPPASVEAVPCNLAPIQRGKAARCLTCGLSSSTRTLPCPRTKQEVTLDR
jgi:hypothetical protein